VQDLKQPKTDYIETGRKRNVGSNPDTVWSDGANRYDVRMKNAPRTEHENQKQMQSNGLRMG
jgi:hypothetical protein